MKIYYSTKSLTAMFITFALLVAISHSFSAHLLHPNIEGFKKEFTNFKDLIYTKIHTQTNQQTQETILAATANLYQDPQILKQGHNTILDITKNPQRQKQFLECSKGKHSEFFKVGAAHVGYIGNKSEHESITLERMPDDCFENVVVNFTNLKKNAINSIEVEIIASGRRKQFCTETYTFATGAKLHVHTISLRNRHKFTWKNMNEVQYNNVVTWGIHVFRLCDSIVHWFPNLIKTAELFVGGIGTNPKIPFFGSKPPKYMQKLNVDFIEAGTGFRWKERNPIFVNLSQYQIKSGDFLAVTRFDGVDQIIQYGAGSHSGHSTVALQVDGVMSIVQSQDGWYWPKHGIQRNDWETWKKWALNAGFNVAVLPLSAQSRAKFDVKKAEQFFKDAEGLPYGYHNFLFGWIDTPKDNYPSLLDPNFVLALFSFLQRVYEYPINRILTQALNKRLGTQNKNLQQIAILMARKNMTFGDLMAMVEKDGWEYNDGRSYVCSAFVAGIYQAGGLLNDIQATEFTPKDVYTLNIFDRSYKVPQKCFRNDPSLPYCQIMGSYLMEMPGYSTIEPYPHMNQRCPTMAPDFFRPDGC